MSLKLILFPTAAACLMLGIHYAVFKSFMHFFSIGRPLAKIPLYTAMVILSLSFISSFILIHWRENLWTVAWYRFAAAWTGFAIHCLAAVAAAWILLIAARLTGVALSAKAVGAAAMVIAVAATVYGMWAAFNPVVRQVAVPVKTLPGAWKNSTIVHLSDLHLGHIHGSGFAGRVAEKVDSMDPDLVLITGDLLDGMGGPYKKNLKALNAIRAEHGIFFVTGNHEHYVGIDRALSLIENTPFQVLDNRAVQIHGLEIVGVSYPGISSIEQIDNLSAEKKEGRVRIAMFHTPTEMGINEKSMEEQHFANYWMPDTSFDLNRKLDADLQLSGHTHHGQIFPVNLLTRLLYRGYDHGLEKNNGFYLYTTAGTGSWGPPMRSSGRPEIAAIRLIEKSQN